VACVGPRGLQQQVFNSHVRSPRDQRLRHTCCSQCVCKAGCRFYARLRFSLRFFTLSCLAVRYSLTFSLVYCWLFVYYNICIRHRRGTRTWQVWKLAINTTNGIGPRGVLRATCTHTGTGTFEGTAHAGRVLCVVCLRLRYTHI
jgi:hypothetical protein